MSVFFFRFDKLWPIRYIYIVRQTRFICPLPFDRSQFSNVQSMYDNEQRK